VSKFSAPRRRDCYYFWGLVAVTPLYSCARAFPRFEVASFAIAESHVSARENVINLRDALKRSSSKPRDDLLENAKREFRSVFKVRAGHEGDVFELGSK
jgi:hypothetical protein